MNLNSEAIKKNDVEIAINNVSVVFKDNQGNDVKALDNIDFDIHKGEFISLLGPSGCGKTTLLRTIADLLEPTSGNVRVSNMTPKEIRLMQKFGIVFQNPVLFEWRTVKKNIELPLEIMGYSKKDRSDRADEMLEMVGLTKFADHYPQQLSGGMQQRVGIARAFGIRPEILLMDEPFSALDEFTKEKLHLDKLDPELVYTTGEILCHPDVHTVIPDYVEFSLDARHEDPRVIEQVVSVIENIPKEVEKCKTGYEIASIPWISNVKLCLRSCLHSPRKKVVLFQRMYAGESKKVCKTAMCRLDTAIFSATAKARMDARKLCRKRRQLFGIFTVCFLMA